MQSRSLARELALLVLGQIPEDSFNIEEKGALEVLLQKAIESLEHHWREVLDNCAGELEMAHQE